MKKALFFVPLLVLIACSGNNEIQPGETFAKYYGDNNAPLELKDMTFQADGMGGLALLGMRTGERFVDETDLNEIGVVVQRFHLVSLDDNGNSMNIVTLPHLTSAGEVDANDMEASKITAVAGGGYLVVGSMDHPTSDVSASGLRKLAVWAQLDPNLEMNGQWMAIGDTVNNYYGVDISVTNDGGVLVTGYTDVNGDNDFFYDKIGGTNDPWNRVQLRANSNDQLVRTLATSTGDFALFGRTDALSGDGETGVNVERTIIDQQGVIVNSLVYGTSVDLGGGNINSAYDDIPYDVIERPGGFTIVGEAGSIVGLFDSSPFMMNVDYTGAISVEENYALDFAEANNNPKEGGARSVTQTLTNDFIVVGDLTDFTAFPGDNKLEKFRNDEIMVMRTDQGGIQVSSITNFGVENGNDQSVRALTAPDGSILVGATYDFGGGLTQFALLKMNTDGELKQ